MGIDGISMDKTKNILDKFLYMGYGKEKLEPYMEELAKDNIRNLVNYSPIILCVLVVMSSLRVVFSGLHIVEVLPFLLAVLIVIGCMIIGRIKLKRDSKYLFTAKILTTTLVVSLYLLAGFYDVIIQQTDLNVTICILFVAIQCMFDSYPLDNLLVTAGAAVFYVILEGVIEPPDIMIANLLNMFTAVIVGVCISWKKSQSHFGILVAKDIEKKMYEAELKTQIMLSQIQPHFLYNTLGVIYHLCDKDPQTAKTATSDFSKYLRMNLDSLKLTAPVPFESELDHVRIYLSFEKMRFEEQLNIVYNIGVTGFLIPALSVQPLVENAVKYGVGKAEDGGTVTITTEETDDSIKIIVSDDGVGFDVDEPKDDGRSHTGIENVRNHLWSMIKGTLDIESVKGVGTKATITIPKGGRS